MTRERKPSTFFDTEVIGDRAFNKVIRDYQRKKVIKKKDDDEPKAQTIVAASTKSAPQKPATVKAGKQAQPRGRPPAVQTPQALALQEIEEKHIAACREVKLRSAKPRKVLPEGAVELEDMETAIKRGVKETSTLLLDWSCRKAKMIGSLCKVYWDGEDTWFYARILNYDSYYDRHYVSVCLSAIACIDPQPSPRLITSACVDLTVHTVDLLLGGQHRGVDRPGARDRAGGRGDGTGAPEPRRRSVGCAEVLGVGAGQVRVQQLPRLPQRRCILYCSVHVRHV